MARLVTVVCNVCYGSGKYLRVGQVYDTEDTSLDSKVVAVLEEQLKKGRVALVSNKPHTSPSIAGKSISTVGVEPKNDMTAPLPEVQENPVEDTEEGASEEVPSADSVIADLAAVTKRVRKPLGKR